MVRLKAYGGCSTSERRYQFQFHKVRLKVDKKGMPPTTYPLFQFHKVRLKVVIRIPEYSARSSVSIPQGTIKRNTRSDTQACATFVSIPQGTIKRGFLETLGGAAIMFQFHKVRLKVYQHI